MIGLSKILIYFSHPISNKTPAWQQQGMDKGYSPPLSKFKNFKFVVVRPKEWQDGIPLFNHNIKFSGTRNMLGLVQD